MWAIRGRIVPMSDQPAVRSSESAVFSGRVWIGDDGRVAAVTKGSKAGPAGSDGAEVVDVGTSLVIPGLIDLHITWPTTRCPYGLNPGSRRPSSTTIPGLRQRAI